MPCFDFQCTNPKCAEKAELVIPFDKIEFVNCAVCSSPMKRVYTVGALSFLFNFMAEDA